MSHEVIPVNTQQEQYVGYIHRAFELVRQIEDNSHLVEKGELGFYGKIKQGIIEGARSELVHPIEEVTVMDNDQQGVIVDFIRTTDDKMETVFNDVVRAEEKNSP